MLTRLHCLSDVRIRAAADEEAKPVERDHLEACVECRARLAAARLTNDALREMASHVPVPASLRSTVEQALTERADRTGATTLRDGLLPRVRIVRLGMLTRLLESLRSVGRSTMPRLLTAGLVTAAVLIVVFRLPPPDAPRTLSAAEILDRSLKTLSPVSGTELREFDLDLRLPYVGSVQNGTYRIEQLVDHDTPGRYRFVRYSPDGAMVAAISEDPVAGRRTAVMRADGTFFRFQFTIDAGDTLDLSELERHHVEGAIRVLQTVAGETVSEVVDERGKRYVVELPAAANANANVPGFYEISQARVLIDASDFQILQLTASGSYLGDAFSISFRLRQRQVLPTAQVPRERFEVPDTAGAVTIDAAGTDDLAHDLLVSALGALARSR
jgi:hypothetical protein